MRFRPSAAAPRYIAAEKIENILVTAPLVAQIFVYGDSLKDVLVAVIVPDVEVMKQHNPSLSVFLQHFGRLSSSRL